ncbi:hypothetical protein GGS26DRAFT_587881 [Hypomontagnella submonticulosa]|nr:hypothetical protein GGS26DRAFT_587881 [Hypomontagnella submonticulosa]
MKGIVAFLLLGLAIAAPVNQELPADDAQSTRTRPHPTGSFTLPPLPTLSLPTGFPGFPTGRPTGRPGRPTGRPTSRPVPTSRPHPTGRPQPTSRPHPTGRPQPTSRPHPTGRPTGRPGFPTTRPAPPTPTPTP